MAGGGPGPGAAQASSGLFRPTRSLATWLTGLLAVQAVSSFLTPIVQDRAHVFVEWHRALDALLDGHQQQANRIIRATGQGSSSAWSLVGVVTAAGAVLLIVWMWRSAHNALALGRTGARLSPGWSIGAWFVPLANLVLLYLIYSDLWRSSDPDSPRGDGWRARPGSALVRCFWGLYVVGYALLFCAVALAVGGVVGEATTRALLVTGGALSAAAALLNILVVRDVTARQEAMQERDPAPTDDAALGGRAPLPRAIVPDDPGWYADPSGHFEHRYWDGGAWTEHVSRGGVATTAPVAPADWYPDPTGRFAWRYWTGHEWTEHASRAGDLYVDPLDGQPDGGAPEAPGSGTA